MEKKDIYVYNRDKSIQVKQVWIEYMAAFRLFRENPKYPDVLFY